MHSLTATITTPKRTLRTYTWSLPESVEELTPRQLRKIARILAQNGHPLDQKMQVLIALGKITRPDILNGEHVNEALKLLDFLDDTEIFIEIPIIKRIGLFFTPKRRMLAFTGDQMSLCDTILAHLDQSTDIPAKTLAEFCAANCTLLRLPWSNRVAHLLTIPFFRYFVRKHTKLALLIQYRAMRRIFPKRYPNAFSGGGTAERFPSLGWPGTFVRLAGDKFGTPTKVKATSAHDLFTYLEQVRRDEIRLEAQNRSRK
jgi:hypothetical protein